MACTVMHNGVMRYLALSLLLVAELLAAQSNQPYRVHALDVGEGQAILLQHGERGVLIDTGHAGMTAKLLEQLESAGVRRLDYLILTHLHPDHASGYFRVREAFPQSVVLDSYLPQAYARKPDMVRWVAETLAEDERRRRIRGGDNVRWEGLELRVLWPAEEPGPDLNRDSLVVEVVDGRPRALLMGDVGMDVERQLLERQQLQQGYELLVAGHHGSSATANQAFLAHVAPGFSVISINADNVRGYPSSDVVARLQLHSREALLKTYQHGAICLQWQGRDAMMRCDAEVK